MTHEFKERFTGNVVEYLGTVEIVDMVEKVYTTTEELKESPDFVQVNHPGNPWAIRLYRRDICVKYRDIKTKRVAVTPLLQFLNFFEPVTKATDDFMQTVDKLLKTDEENREDICALHSEQPENNETTTAE